VGLFLLLQNFGDTNLLVILQLLEIQISVASYLCQIVLCGFIYLLIIRLGIRQRTSS
jgi:hypothetical protein